MLKIPFTVLIVVAMTIVSLLQAAPTNLQNERSDFVDESTTATDEFLDITAKTLSEQRLNENVIHADSVPLYSRANSWHTNGSNDGMPATESMPQQEKNTIVVDGYLNQHIGSITTTERLSDSTTVQPPQNFTLRNFISDHSTINYSTETAIVTTEYGANADGNSLSLPSTMQPEPLLTETTNNGSELTITTGPPVIFKPFEDLPDTLDNRNDQQEQTTIRSDKAEVTEAGIAIEKVDEIVHRNVEIIEETEPKSNNEVETEKLKVDNEVEQTEAPISLQEDELVNFNAPIKEENVGKENLDNEIFKDKTTVSPQNIVTELNDGIKEQLKESQREYTTKIAEETPTTEVTEENQSVQSQKYFNGNFDKGLNSMNDMNAFLQEYKMEETTTQIGDTPTTTETNKDITDVTVKDDAAEDYLNESPNVTETVIKDNHEPLEQPVQTIMEDKEEPAVVGLQDYATTTDITTSTLSVLTEYVTLNPLHFGIDAKTETDVSQTTKETESTSTENFTKTPDATSTEESTTEVELNIKPIHATTTEYTTITEQPTTYVQTTTTEQITTPVQITTTDQPTIPTQTTTEEDSEEPKNTTYISPSNIEEQSDTSPIMPTTTELSQFKFTATTTSTTPIEHTTAIQEPSTTLGHVQETDQSYTDNVKLLNTPTTEVIYTTSKPIDVELQQTVNSSKAMLSETEEKSTNLETPTIITTETTAVAPTTTINPTTNILNELTETTVIPIAVMPEARALNTPAPVHIERIFNEDGVEVLFGYSSVSRTNLN